MFFLKNLYGLKQSPRAWFRRYDDCRDLSPRSPMIH